MSRWLPFGLCLALWATGPAVAHAQGPHRPAVLVVVGAPGTAEYGAQFKAWAERWQKVSTQAKANLTVIGLQKSEQTDLKTLEQFLTDAADATAPLWIVLIGHGTFDGKTAKFNLRGPDLEAGHLAGQLKNIKRPVALVNCAASSAPFIPACSGAKRVIITATKSGFEDNWARFGDHLSQAIADPEADLNGDGQVALLEAFVTAADRTAKAYALDGRLATEHPLIDDNGDGKGSRSEWFTGKPGPQKTKAGAAVDGRLAKRMHLIESELEQKLTADQRAARDRLEIELDKLREKKQDFDSIDYDRRLEALLIRIAQIYDAAEKPAP